MINACPHSGLQYYSFLQSPTAQREFAPIEDRFERSSNTMSAVKFSGVTTPNSKHPYLPSDEVLDNIGKALTETPIFNSTGTPVSFFPSPALEQDLYHWLDNLQNRRSLQGRSPKEPLPHDLESIAQRLATQKQQISAIYQTAVGVMHNKDKTIQDARKALIDLDFEYRQCRSFFKGKSTNGLGLKAPEISLFQHTVAKTVPMLFYMGFDDALPHAAQVSRLSAAWSQSFLRLSGPQLMSAVLVGWLHDCKLDGQWSIDNMTTHPVVSAAVAKHIFSQPDMQSILDQLDINDPETFIKNITEALALNNDSLFVLEQAFLNGLGPSAGLLNGIDGFFRDESASHIIQVQNIVKDWALRRFYAPSKGETAPTMETYLAEKKPLDSSMERSIQAIFDVNTGLKIGTGIYQHSATGGLEELTIPVCYAFSHHQEVSDGAKPLALTLVNADPLMLSPHKILRTNRSKKPIERIQSYLESLDNNIRFIPLEPEDARRNARMFQRGILLAMLHSADEFRQAQRPVYPLFIKEHQDTPLDASLEDLMKILGDPMTWGKKWSSETDLSKAPDERFNALCQQLEADYEAMRLLYRNTVRNINVPSGKFDPFPAPAPMIQNDVKIIPLHDTPGS